jgi:glucoamylase
MKCFPFLTLITLLFTASSSVADPAGAPGIAHQWDSAQKQAVGTAYESNGQASSPVWFTLAQGIVTEIFYPSPDQAQVGNLQFLVSDGQSFFSDQKGDTTSEVSYADEGMAVLVKGQEKEGRYTFEQEIITDPAAPVVRVRTTFHWNQPGLRVFVLFKPAIGNSGSQNLAVAASDALFATNDNSQSSSQPRAQTWAALVPSIGFKSVSTGYVGYTDGYQDVSKNYHLTVVDREAGPGNIALTGELPTGPAEDFTYEVALGFGSAQEEAQTFAKTSLQVPFDQVKNSYDEGWHAYLSELQKNVESLRFFSESTFARRSAQLIKMHEDKLNRGAIVASLSNPSIPGSDSAPDASSGYHLVWPRDLYHAAMGLLAAGDLTTPVDVLHYLEAHQKSDGSWAQNFRVDGTAVWQGLQMDEVSFPILLASQLQSRKTYKLQSADLEMVKKAASFIMSHGPSTPQDRWEEMGGYSPDTIAAEIAGLREASALSQDDSYASVANQWQSMLERWTLAPNGIWGGNYYVRISPNGTPEDSEPITLANGGGPAFSTDIIDGGFLNLVRMGVRSATDPRILTTLAIYDNPTSGISLPDNRTSGMTYRRYTRDGYGENGQGGFWPLLAGERGHYAILVGDRDQARSQLFMVEKSANPSGLIPEQTISAGSDAGAGVACPLVWAQAEDILLHRSIEEGTVFDAPRSTQ